MGSSTLPASQGVKLIWPEGAEKHMERTRKTSVAGVLTPKILATSQP